MKPIRRIGISTGGGDAPGLNAVIRSVTLAARNRGWDVVGIRDGFNGLMNPEEYPDGGLIDLTRDRVRGIAHLGGTTHRATFTFKRRAQEWFRGAVTAPYGESVRRVGLGQAAVGDLDGVGVNVASEVAAFQPFGHHERGAATAEEIRDQVSFVRAGPDDPFQKGFGFLSGVAGAFLRHRGEKGDVPHVG